jgi:hypothetical protein
MFYDECCEVRTRGRDRSGKPTARNERGLVADSPAAAQMNLNFLI